MRRASRAGGSRYAACAVGGDRSGTDHLVARSDPKRAIIRFGPVGINPSLAMRDVGVDNNVFHDDVDPKSDFTFTVTPRADVLFSPRRLHLVFGRRPSTTSTSRPTTARQAPIALPRSRPTSISDASSHTPRSPASTPARATTARSTIAPAITITPTLPARCCTSRRGLISGAVRRTTTISTRAANFAARIWRRPSTTALDGVDGTSACSSHR